MSSLEIRAFDLYYTITRSNETRSGVMRVVSQPADGSTVTQVYSDEYSETFDIGVTLAAQQINSTVTVIYTTTNTGATGTMTYSISHLA